MNQRVEVDINEIVAYYFFAACKDNVAKFNPKEPKRPTYFTEALLFSVEGGTDSESEIITMGELYEYLCKQINRLKNENPDIPDPRPVLEGNVSGFHFCKNKRFESKEDKDWVQLAKNPSVTELQNFQSKYPSTRYGSAINNLWRRLIAGYDALEEARATNDKVAVLKIKEEYTDIPIIFKQAIDLLNTMSSKYIEMEKNSRMAKPKEILQEASTMVSDSAKEFSSSTTQPEISEASPNLSQADINIKEGSMDKQKPAEMNSIRMESNQMASNSAAR